VVIKRSIDVGQTVAASLSAPELFVIARDLRDMEVQASIDEADVANIRVGQRTSFTVDALPGRTFEGAVKQIRKAAQIVQNVVTYTVVVSADNGQLLLLPGMTANVRVITATRDNALKVANAALRYRPPGEPATPAAGAPSATPTAAPAASPGAAGAPGGQGGPGGQMRQQRDRLVAELKLDAAQTEKLDAIYADMRSKFMGLRDLPEEERRRAGERNRAEMREKIATILNPEQKKRYETIVAEQAATRGGQGGGRGRIFVLEDGKPVGKDVRLGLTDGSTTEVIAEGLAEGTVVIIGNATTQQAQAGRPTTTGGPGPRLF
jgi:HlyD family secretion protein